MQEGGQGKVSVRKLKLKQRQLVQEGRQGKVSVRKLKQRQLVQGRSSGSGVCQEAKVKAETASAGKVVRVWCLSGS